MSASWTPLIAVSKRNRRLSKALEATGLFPTGIWILTCPQEHTANISLPTSVAGDFCHTCLREHPEIAERLATMTAEEFRHPHRDSEWRLRRVEWPWELSTSGLMTRYEQWARAGHQEWRLDISVREDGLVRVALNHSTKMDCSVGMGTSIPDALATAWLTLFETGVDREA